MVPPAAESVMPPVGAEYHEFYKTPRNRWWRGLLAIILLIAAFGILSSIVGVINPIVTGGFGFNPGGEYVNNWFTLATGTAGVLVVLPFTFLIQRWVYRIPGGFLSSVVGAFRWRMLARYAAVIVPLYVVITIALSLMFGLNGQKAFTGQTVALL